MNNVFDILPAQEAAPIVKKVSIFKEAKLKMQQISEKNI